jgi:8-amino-3,8-dideoxy-alpha-D-manno-octulosonate transaminase
MLTCGEGGAFTTDDDELAARAREYHDHGHENNPAVPRGRDTRRAPGFNFRMSELQGAVGSAQLRKLDGMIEANRRWYGRLEEAVRGIDGLELRRVPEPSTPAADALIFLLPDRDAADRFVAGMGEAGLGTKNLPDAIDWHFAGTWTHMLGELGLDEVGLAEATRRSDELLRRAVAVPIMVRYTDERVDEIAADLQRIAAEVL